MIRLYVSPDLLPDNELQREYQTTDGEDDRAVALLAEIERRGLGSLDALPPGVIYTDRDALEKRVPDMPDAELRRGYHACEVESPEADLYAGS